MLKPFRAFLAIGLLIVTLAVIPVSKNIELKTFLYSSLEKPFGFARGCGLFLSDLFYFHQNAEENRSLKKSLASLQFQRLQSQDFQKENERLSALLGLKQALPGSVHRYVVARVGAIFLTSWNRVFLIDKGLKEGVKTQMLVLSNLSLVGKVIEAGPGMAKVRLVNDPNSRIGVQLQRTRQQGILFGTAEGDCRLKYLPMDAVVKPGDVVQTVGFGAMVPKGLPVGEIRKVWKEPGQMYQVASVKLYADIGRLEEVVVAE